MIYLFFYWWFSIAHWCTLLQFTRGYLTEFITIRNKNNYSHQKATLVRMTINSTTFMRFDPPKNIKKHIPHMIPGGQRAQRLRHAGPLPPALALAAGADAADACATPWGLQPSAAKRWGKWLDPKQKWWNYIYIYSGSKTTCFFSRGLW